MSFSMIKNQYYIINILYNLITSRPLVQDLIHIFFKTPSVLKLFLKMFTLKTGDSRLKIGSL